MQYSPKLKKAMQEIKRILNENDIAGVVFLHTPGHSEYLNHFETSYSCAKVEPEGIMMKVNSKEVGQEKAMQLANDTYNMLTHIVQHFGPMVLYYINAHEMLEKKIGGIQGPGHHSSEESQNN